MNEVQNKILSQKRKEFGKIGRLFPNWALLRINLSLPQEIRLFSHKCRNLLRTVTKKYLTTFIISKKSLKQIIFSDDNDIGDGVENKETGNLILAASSDVPAKAELSFCQLLTEHLIVSLPFPIFSSISFGSEWWENLLNKSLNSSIGILTISCRRIFKIWPNENKDLHFNYSHFSANSYGCYKMI